MAVDRAEPEGNAGDEPMKPQFAPLSAFEQDGRRVEFRRVSAHCFALCGDCRAARRLEE